MSEAKSAAVDLIQELRLRQWARAHYAPPEKRCTSWHPIVLDEMRKKEVELRESPHRYGAACRYVPLPPSPTHILHGPHDHYGRPKSIPEYRPSSTYHYG